MGVNGVNMEKIVINTLNSLLFNENKLLEGSKVVVVCNRDLPQQNI